MKPFAILLILCSPLFCQTIGVNVSEGNYWGGEHYYSNLLTMGPGVRQDQPTEPDSGNIKFDSNGVIEEIPNKAIIYRLMRDGIEPGRYVVTYDGEPYDSSKYVDDAGAQRGSSFVKSEGNGGTLSIEPKVGHDPNLFACRHESSSGKYRAGLKGDLSPFGVVRYMDLMHTNLPALDGGRKPPQLRTFQGNESYTIDVEEIIELSRLTGTRPWICMHHGWSNAFAIEFLTTLSEAGISAIVEGGNENWHTGRRGSWEHGNWAKDNADGGNARLWALKWFVPWHRIAKQLGHENVICTQVAGVNSETGAIQLGNTRALIQGIGEDIELFDGLYVNGYFGNVTLSSDLANNFDLINAAMDELFVKASASRDYAQSVGLDFGFYECGPSINGFQSRETSNDPRFRQVMQRFVTWCKSNTKASCIYTRTWAPRNNSNWGLSEYAGQDPTPKLLGVLDAIGTTPPEPDPEEPEPVTRRLDPRDIQLIADEVERRIDSKTFTTKVDKQQ